MRISDWSSDVCSSDLLRPGLVLLRDYFGNRNKDEALPRLALAVMQIERRFVRDGQMAQQVHDGIVAIAPLAERLGSDHPDVLEIGRASRRERVCQYV